MTLISRDKSFLEKQLLPDLVANDLGSTFSGKTLTVFISGKEYNLIHVQDGLEGHEMTTWFIKGVRIHYVTSEGRFRRGEGWALLLRHTILLSKEKTNH